MRLILLTAVTMIAFAANSVLCRMALAGQVIDATSFTAIRLLSGAVMLVLLLWYRASCSASQCVRLLQAGSWSAAGWLCLYASAFSLAYLSLTAATGALILFGAVQLTMMTASLLSGERPTLRTWMGYALASVGLLWLLLPGVAAPPLWSAALMGAAGLAWGMYSLQGRGADDSLAQTAGNFLLSLPMAALMLLLSLHSLHLSLSGVLLAVASGALASGLGYALWYVVVAQVDSAMAATVQLAVPLLAAAAGVWLLQEPLTLRLLLSGSMILGGIALVVHQSAARTA